MKTIKYSILNETSEQKICLYTCEHLNLYTNKSNNYEYIITSDLSVEKIVEHGENLIPLNGYVISNFQSLELEVGDKVTIENITPTTYVNSLINQDNQRLVIHGYNRRNWGNEIVLLDRKYSIFTIPHDNCYEMVVHLNHFNHKMEVSSIKHRQKKGKLGKEIDKGTYVLLCNDSNLKIVETFKEKDNVHFEYPLVTLEKTIVIDYTDYNPNYNVSINNDASVYAFRDANTCMIYDENAPSMNKKTRLTGTNVWGHEVAVVNGIITDSNVNVAIPKNGYVISGVSQYYEILKNDFKLGSKVVLDTDNKKVTLFYNHLDSCIYQYLRSLEQIETILKKAHEDYFDLDGELLDEYYKKYLELKDKLYSRREIIKYATGDEKLYHLYRFDGYFNKSVDYFNQIFKLSIEPTPVEVRACWHYPLEKSLAEIEDTLDTLKESNFNEIIVGAVMREGVIYNSKRYGKTKNVVGYFGEEYQDDYLLCLIKEAKKRNIKVQISSDNFFICDFILDQHPEYEKYLAISYEKTTGSRGPGEITKFFDPAQDEVHNIILDIYREILDKYEIAGLQLDYIRYCVGNDSYVTSYGYNEVTTKKFMDEYNLQGNIFELVKDETIFNQFCDFRRAKVTEFVGKCKSLLSQYNNVQLTIAVVSDYEIAKQTKLQDWKTWVDKGYIDGIYLMAYHIGEEPVFTDCSLAKQLSNENSFVYGGIAPIFNGSHIGQVLKQINCIYKSEVDGSSLFAYHSFSNRPDLYYYYNNNGPFKRPAVSTYEKIDIVIEAYYQDTKRKCEEIYMPHNLINQSNVDIILKAIKDVIKNNKLSDVDYSANKKVKLHIDATLNKIRRYLHIKANLNK